MTDDRESDGKFLTRPEGAAPLFDIKGGADAARVRWDRERDNTRQAIIAFASEKEGRELNFDEAMNIVVNDPQFIKSLEGHTAAAKFISQKVDVLPGGGVDGAVVTDARSVTIIVQSFDNMPQLVAMMEDLKGAGKLVAAARIKEQIEAGVSLDSIELQLD